MFGAWGGSLGASVRANVRVRLAGSGRFYLECTVGGPVVYMGRLLSALTCAPWKMEAPYHRHRCSHEDQTIDGVWETCTLERACLT